jgi:hypothetical protein
MLFFGLFLVFSHVLVTQALKFFFPIQGVLVTWAPGARTWSNFYDFDQTRMRTVVTNRKKELGRHRGLEEWEIGRPPDTTFVILYHENHTVTLAISELWELRMSCLRPWGRLRGQAMRYPGRCLRTLYRDSGCPQSTYFHNSGKEQV